MQYSNTFKIARRLAGHCVTIEARYSERLGLYGLRVAVDDDLWDWTQSDDVLRDAGTILAEVYETLTI